MQANQTPVIWSVVGMTALLLVLGIFATMSINSNLALLGEKLDGFDIDEVALANAIAVSIVIPEMPEYEYPDYVLSEFEYEENLIEAEAERLVLDEIDSKDFKKLVFDALDVDLLEGEGEGIEDWKDITDIVVKDLDVLLIIYDEYATSDPPYVTVTVDLKVYYYIDGDEDEDFRARFEGITFTVSKLVVDDDFEDAEVLVTTSPTVPIRVY